MGWAGRLLAEAERIAFEEFESSTVAVFSGVGARQYYAELGYEFNSGYMVKRLAP